MNGKLLLYCKIISFILTTLIAGCSLFGPSEPGEKPAFLTGNNISGDLEGDNLWDETVSVYRIVGITEIPCGSTLSIYEGSRVVIEPGGSLVVRGVLNITGSENNPVSVSSSEGDSPAPGIAVEGPCGQCNISGCSFSGFDIGILLSGTSSVMITDCTFDATETEGIRSEFSSGTVDSCLFSGCGCGIRSLESNLSITGCSFDSCNSHGYKAFYSADSLNGCSFTGGGESFIYVDQGRFSMKGSLVTSGWEPETAVFLRNYVSGIIDSCVITGGRRGIYCHTRGFTLSRNVFRHISGEAVSCFGSNPAITANSIDSCGTAIGLYSGSDARITGNTISACSGVGILVIDSHPVINSNNLVGTTDGRDIVECNERTTPIDATENWWGASSGPYHPLYNPTGGGSRVGDFIAFTPWSSASF